MREKLKSLILSDHGFYSLLVILVGFGGYFLGYEEASVKNIERLPRSEVVEEKAVEKALEAKVVKTPTSQEAAVVASKSGTKYHLPSCPGAAQIKSDNRLEFDSIAEAEAAGYKPATNCPGLVQ